MATPGRFRAHYRAGYFILSTDSWDARGSRGLINLALTKGQLYDRIGPVMNMDKATPNPETKRQLEEAKRELERVKQEKAALYPPNLHPLAEPDSYPQKYTPEQIRRRNQLNAQIESLEARIEELQNRLYAK